MTNGRSIRGFNVIDFVEEVGKQQMDIGNQIIDEVATESKQKHITSHTTDAQLQTPHSPNSTDTEIQTPHATPIRSSILTPAVKHLAAPA